MSDLIRRLRSTGPTVAQQGSTLSYTIGGESRTPVAVMVFTTHVTSLSSITQGEKVGLGMSDGTTHYALSDHDVDNSANVDSYISQWENSRLINIRTTASTNDLRGNFSSFTTGGVQITWAVVGSNGDQTPLEFVFIFNDGDTSVSLDIASVDRDPTGSPTTVTTGFEAEWGIVWYCNNANETSSSANNTYSLGAFVSNGDGSATQSCLMRVDDDGATEGDTHGYMPSIATNYCAGDIAQSTDAINVAFRIQSIGATSFAIDSAAGGTTGNRDVAVLSVSFGGTKLIDLDVEQSPSSISTQTEGSVSIVPEFAIRVQSTIETLSSVRANTNGDEGGGVGVCLWGSTDSAGSLSWCAENDAPTTNTASYQSSNYIDCLQDDQADQITATATANTSGGLDVAYSNILTNQVYAWQLLFGTSPITSSGVTSIPFGTFGSVFNGGATFYGAIR